ncbi:MAG TPA: hypothetical protein VFW87_05950 [Pirellulales bacterium]|nr:hypothetical protein [Pirellulales bacterium]
MEWSYEPLYDEGAATYVRDMLTRVLETHSEARECPILRMAIFLHTQIATLGNTRFSAGKATKPVVWDDAGRGRSWKAACEKRTRHGSVKGVA